MFYLNKDTPLDAALLYKMINKFHTSVEPNLIKYKNYYDGNQKVLQRSYSDASKPCNKTLINYCKNIVDSYCGYLATPSYISYTTDDVIMDVLKYNDYQAQDADFLLNALTHGVACELMYIDADGKTRFRQINPTQCFGVYDDSLTSDLMYFIRMYKVNEWDDSNTYHVDVYGDTSVQHYSMAGKQGQLTFLSEEPHYFGQCPANIFYLPDEKSIFDCILSLQDSVNEILSSEIDDYSAFCDAYLTLTGDFDVDSFSEQLPEMKENRVLILPKEAVADWLTKNASDTQVENIIKRLHDSIYRIAQCPDFSSETFVGGVSSGIAIKYRLTGMETRAGKIEAEMKKALQRRIEIICGIASLKLGEEVFRDAGIDFKRNIPSDNTEIVNLVNSLKGTVSDATLLGMLPFVDDVNAEIEAVEAQKQHNMEVYGFNLPTEDDEEDTEEDNQ